MKTLFIAALMAVMAVSCPAEQQQDRSKQHHDEAKKAPPVLATPPATPPNYQASQVRQCCCKDDTESIGEKATAPETWPNWAVVIAALGAIWATIKTLFTIKRQADLQQAAMQQWVNIQDWRGWYDDSSARLNIEFNIMNQTSFPITIEKFTILFGLPGAMEISPLEPNFRLTPNNPQAIPIEIPISPDGKETYIHHGLIFSVRGEILHSDMGPKGHVQMPIYGYLKCRHGSTNQKAIFHTTANPPI